MEVSPEPMGKQERQAAVANYLVMGWTQRRIAQRLGVTEATISRDVKALNERFLVAAAQDIRLAKGIDLERIDQLLAANLPRALAQKWPDSEGKLRDNRGQVSATRVVKELLELRAKILGTEAPQVIKQTVDVQAYEANPALEGWTDEQFATAYEVLRGRTPLALGDGT